MSGDILGIWIFIISVMVIPYICWRLASISDKQTEIENMWYRLETIYYFKYNQIYKQYGSVLKNYEIKEMNGNMYIKIDSLETLCQLDQEISKYCDEETDEIYFGILLRSDDKGKWIEIKDDYD